MKQEDKRNRAIGIFDSGVGGLTVAGEIMRHLPGESIVYFGDTARVPYGGKSKETVTRYARQIIRFLLSQRVKAIVIACNTASAYALSAVRSEFSLPISGVIKPGAAAAITATKNKRIGVIGTHGTIESGVYSRFIGRLKPAVKVFEKACPLFVPLVEEGWVHEKVTQEIAARYLESLQEKEIDTLILGCTHYPHLKEVIGTVMGKGVRLVNPAQETAKTVKKILEREELLKTNEKKEARHRFYVSDMTKSFAAFANASLPCTVDAPEKVDIERFA